MVDEGRPTHGCFFKFEFVENAFEDGGDITSRVEITRTPGNEQRRRPADIEKFILDPRCVVRFGVQGS